VKEDQYDQANDEYNNYVYEKALKIYDTSQYEPINNPIEEVKKVENEDDEDDEDDNDDNADNVDIDKDLSQESDDLEYLSKDNIPADRNLQIYNKIYNRDSANDPNTKNEKKKSKKAKKTKINILDEAISKKVFPLNVKGILKSTDSIVNIPGIPKMYFKNKNIFKDYHVVKDLYDINLLFYDFKKNVLSETVEKGNRFQMEKNYLEMNKNFPDVNSFLKKPMPKRQFTLNMIEKEKLTNDDDDDSLNDEEHNFIKQIKYALNKEENQPTITMWKVVSLLICCLILGFVVVFFIFLILTLDEVQLNLQNFKNSFLIHRNIVISYFYVMEKVLINNHDYIRYYGHSETEKYKQNITDILSLKYEENYKMKKDLEVSNSNLNQSFYDTLFVDRINNYIVFHDSIKTVKDPINTTILKMISLLYKIIALPQDESNFDNKVIFKYMINGQNTFYEKLWVVHELYKKQISLDIDNAIFKNVILVSLSLVIAIIGYFLSIISFLKVVEKKESYIEIFFDINDKIIKESMRRCEKFIKFINVSVINLILFYYNFSLKNKKMKKNQV